MALFKAGARVGSEDDSGHAEEVGGLGVGVSVFSILFFCFLFFAFCFLPNTCVRRIDIGPYLDAAMVAEIYRANGIQVCVLCVRVCGGWASGIEVCGG